MTGPREGGTNANQAKRHRAAEFRFAIVEYDGLWSLPSLGFCAGERAQAALLRIMTGKQVSGRSRGP